MSTTVDLTRIQESSDGDIEFERELITLYLEDANTHRAAISGFIERKEYSSLNARARVLKGSSANIGASAVHQIALELEKLALTQDSAPLPDALNRLVGALAETDTFFREYLASR